MSQLINEKGNHYGALTVIELTKDHNNRTAWRCLCDCGNYKIVRGPDLRKGKITSCGCGIFKNRNKMDLSNKIFGFLTVIKEAREKYNTISKKRMQKCQCICGKICFIETQSLLDGKTKSCGCQSNYLNALSNTTAKVGDRFGKLIILSFQKDSQNTLTAKCQCDCGNIKEVKVKYLTSGNTKSCGCLQNHSSYATYAIQEFLKNNDINYKTEVTFSSLISETKHKLRFDFGIYNSNGNLLFLIEYQGPQHYFPVELFGGEQYLQKLHKHDLMKKEYCNKNNILLVEYNYTQSIEQIKDNLMTLLVKQW